MANFGCIPQELLEKILEFLPQRDQINGGMVCAHWNEVVGFNLKHVTIDASMPFGGRWMEENMRWIDGSRHDDETGWVIDNQKTEVWNRDENELADMRKLIQSLCKLSNKIQTLKIYYYLLQVESLTELFSSQTAIKTLVIRIRPLPIWAQNVYYEKIIEVIIRH